jgi:molecular chaperone DnaK
VFSTAADSQPAVDINILQGERPMAKDNVSLGKFSLTGILPAPRGVPQIDVTFDIDANGILHVSAKDQKTGKEQGMQVVAPNKMGRDDIDKKVKEAEEYAAQDKEALERVQSRNEAESMVYTTEKTLKDNAGKIPKDVAERVEQAKNELNDALGKDDSDAIKEKLDNLKSVLQQIGSSVYGNGQQGQGGQGPEPGPDQGPGPEGQGGAGDSADANFRG